jgi:hypothetical protein
MFFNYSNWSVLLWSHADNRASSSMIAPSTERKRHLEIPDVENRQRMVVPRSGLAVARDARCERQVWTERASNTLQENGNQTGEQLQAFAGDAV